jgi:outer membrane protein assembly factor BamB
VGDVVVVGSCKGTLSALDADSGVVVWQYDITRDGDQTNFHGDPLVAEEFLFIGTDGEGGGHLYAFDAYCGDVLWKYAHHRGVATDILRFDSSVIAATLSDDLICLDLLSGELLWIHPGDFDSDERYLNQSPAITDAAVFFAGADGILRSHDPYTGDVSWSLSLGGRATTSVAAADGFVYVGTELGQLWKVDAASGEEVTILELPGVPSQEFAHADNLLFVYLNWAQPGSEIAAIDAAEGTVAWRRRAPDDDRWTAARPYLVDGTVVAGSKTGLIEAFRTADGDSSWTARVNGTVRGMGFSKDAAFVGTLGGMLYRLEFGEFR